MGFNALKGVPWDCQASYAEVSEGFMECFKGVWVWFSEVSESLTELLRKLKGSFKVLQEIALCFLVISGRLMEVAGSIQGSYRRASRCFWEYQKGFKCVFGVSSFGGLSSALHGSFRRVSGSFERVAEGFRGLSR